MGTGNDMQFGVATEVTYGTRVAPARFFDVIISENFDLAINYYQSRGLGGALWKKRRVQTTKVGGGGFDMEVPTAGFGYLLDKLHPNVVTPAQQAATAAYLQTHSLSGGPTKSMSVQVGTPPVTGSVQPFDFLGVMVSEVTFSWDVGGVLTSQWTCVFQDQSTAQSLATVTAPTDYNLLSFKGGAITFGGSNPGNIIGSGSVTITFPLREEFYLGSAGLIAKPILTDKPTVTGQVTADFDSLTNYNRVTGGTLADVVVTFEGATIASTYKEMLRITIPDAGFTGPRPMVEGPGPLTETISFEAASQTGLAADIPKIEYQSTDTGI